MTSLRIVFVDGTNIRVFVKAPEEFEHNIVSACASIEAVVTDNTPYRETPEECSITLVDGVRLTCSMLPSEMTEACSRSPRVLYCERVYATELLAMATKEECIDARLTAVANVINNIPDKAMRLKLHGMYLKRKEAYAASMEALVDALMRGSFNEQKSS